MKKHLITFSALALAASTFVGCQTDDTMDEPAGAQSQQSSDTMIEESSGAEGTMQSEDELRRRGGYRQNQGTSEDGLGTGDSSSSGSRGSSSGAGSGTGSETSGSGTSGSSSTP